MEGVKTDATGPTIGEGIVGNNPQNAEEKLLPPGHAPEKPAAPQEPKLSAKDLLHGGNAVLAAQSAMAQKDAVPVANEAPVPVETEFEKNLREAGLKEALERPGAAPERVEEVPAEQAPDGAPRIRTYAADMSEEIKKRGAALSTIIVAEQARTVPLPEPEKPRTRRGLLIIVGAGVFIMLGIGAITAAVVLTSGVTTTGAPSMSIIPFNHLAQITQSSTTSLAQTLASARASAKMSLGEIEAFGITKDGTPLSAYDILTALGAPDQLARNATGILAGIHAADHTQPFLLISVSAYDRAFAGMLAWEGTIGDTLGNFFAPNSVSAQSIAAHAPALSFEDVVLQNLDARESQDVWPILYTFPRRDLLLITTNQSTLREILSRLSLQSAGAK